VPQGGPRRFALEVSKNCGLVCQRRSDALKRRFVAAQADTIGHARLAHGRKYKEIRADPPVTFVLSVNNKEN